MNLYIIVKCSHLLEGGITEAPSDNATSLDGVIHDLKGTINNVEAKDN